MASCRHPGLENGELEYYTPRLKNVYIENPAGSNGMLVIQALEEDYETREYTSGSLNTRGKFDQLYGRFEARIKIPYGQGIWPAFWMLSSSGGWPLGGEIDIMENIGKEPNIVHGTMHGPGLLGRERHRRAVLPAEGQRFADDFHLFAVEWEPNVIRWYVDNTLYKTNTPADLPEGAEWVYDHAFYFNSERGGRRRLARLSGRYDRVPADHEGRLREGVCPSRRLADHDFEVGVRIDRSS